MGYITAIVFSLVLACAYAQQCGVSSFPSGRVIGGRYANHGAWPWQILLLENGRPGCGGTIVGPNTVVTASHCVVDPQSGRTKSSYRFSVRVGDNNRRYRDQGEADYRVSRVISHPYFSFRSFHSDVAVLILSTPIRFDSPYVQPACMPTFNPRPGTQCYITGWGREYRHAREMSMRLKQARMPVVAQNTCTYAMRRVAPFALGNHNICAGRGDAIQSGCQGDSGGPFVCKNSAGKWELHGAVSWGSKDCSASRGQYTVFANIMNLSGWIRRYGGNLSS